MNLHPHTNRLLSSPSTLSSIQSCLEGNVCQATSKGLREFAQNQLDRFLRNQADEAKKSKQTDGPSWDRHITDEKHE